MSAEVISSEITEVDLTAEPVKVPFFAVSVFKLAVMGICTLGVYEFYWFYKNWQAIRNREFSTINPSRRAVFALFFSYQLFANIRDYGNAQSVPTSLAAGTLAVGWTVFSLFGLLPDPAALLSLFALLFMLPVQATINQINRTCAPDHAPNDQFSTWNRVWIVIGSILTLGVILTSFSKHTRI